ncbi:MAG: ammonium transporter [Actinomycetes bacterium]
MNTVDTLWVLLSAALVLFMTPGLALFYGGMVRSKNVLSVMMNSFIAMGVITVLWVVIGGSLAFGSDVGGGLLGDLSLAGFANLAHHLPGFSAGGASPMAVMTYQMMFAIITAALISGGTTDRIKFSAFVILISLWMLLVYVPLAHWVFSPEGWLASRGVLDFAGGTVVEINSGFSTLAIVLVLGKRRGWPGEAMAPHSVPLSLLGVGILWFGWFGFNAGSSLGMNDVAVHAFINTQLAAAAGLLGWLLFERVKESYPTTLGAASGAVAGLVAITPCAGFVTPMASLAIGAIAGVVCALAVRLKFKLKYDDSLDVLGVHGVGGLIGMVLLGLFATKSINPNGADGLFAGGGFKFLGLEVLAAGVTVVFAFCATWVIAKVIDMTMGLRVSHEQEFTGLDLTQHAESAYSLGGMGRISS